MKSYENDKVTKIRVSCISGHKYNTQEELEKVHQFFQVVPFASQQSAAKDNLY